MILDDAGLIIYNATIMLQLLSRPFDKIDITLGQCHKPSRGTRNNAVVYLFGKSVENDIWPKSLLTYMYNLSQKKGNFRNVSSLIAQ